MIVSGICKLCKEDKKLSYEHFPPRSAFNKTTRFYQVSINDFYQNFEDYNKSKKIKSKIQQGGLGDYCLCEECNNFLGANYVNDYVHFAKICQALINHNEFKSIGFKIKKEELNFKYFLKQVVSIFICNNQPWFTDTYPELLDFVKNKESSFLPDKFRFYLYLNDEGQIRNGNWTFDNINGEICEFTFPPFGLVLNINNDKRIDEVSEITSFKNYENFMRDEFEIYLNKYSTNSPIPLDFSDKND